jgi:hypothetical protein
MTYHDNHTPPPAPRGSGYGVLAVLGILALLVLGGLALSMMGKDNVATTDRSVTSPATTGSGSAAPAPQREKTGQPLPQRTAPPAKQ